MATPHPKSTTPAQAAPSLAVSGEADRRRRLLDQPLFEPLLAHRRWLLAQRCGEVPYPDPLDGGAAAPLLFLLEKPGRGLSTPRFVSRDNHTPTARAIAEFMAAAGVPRDATLLWNAVPWWNGTARITAAELADGLSALARLLAVTDPACVVTVGARAAEVWRRLGDPRPSFASAHPSPNVRAAFPLRWAAIPTVWREAYRAVG